MNRKLTYLFLFFLSLHAVSQKSINSPLSSYGLGEFNPINHGSFSALGNCFVTQSDSMNLNHYNPASYSFLGIGQPIFNINFAVRNSTFSENQEKFVSNHFAINDFALGIPFGKRFGIAFGLKPFANKGYEFSEKTLINKDTIKNTYSGKGSLNQSFLGFSVKILNKKTHKLAIGTNISYVFGSVSDTRLAHITTLKTGGASSKTLQMKSLHYDFGLNYVYKLKHNRVFQSGITYIPSQNMTSFNTTEIYSVFDVNNERSYDILSSVYEKGSYTRPTSTSFGLSYTYRPKIDSSFNKTKIPQFIFMGQFSNSNWSGVKNEVGHQLNVNYLNTISLSLGVEFTANFNYLERSKNSGYFSKIKYRTGFQYTTLPIELQNEQLSNTGITFGLSLPIISQRSVSSFNIGFVYGKNGNSQNTNLNEKYLGFNIGVNIAPGSYDRWFRKYKID
jgi:hypothetical protein